VVSGVNGASQLRGLTDVRTSVSTHGPARPRRRESVHLELYRLEKERQRLEVELSLLLKRAARLGKRVSEIDVTRASLLAGTDAGASPDPPVSPEPANAVLGWRRMTVTY
jgi:hypothetical protein